MLAYDQCSCTFLTLHSIPVAHPTPALNIDPQVWSRLLVLSAALSLGPRCRSNIASVIAKNRVILIRNGKCPSDQTVPSQYHLSSHFAISAFHSGTRFLVSHSLLLLFTAIKGLLDCHNSDCHGTGAGACSSDWVFGLVSDMVLIPKDLAPGDYVLSWR